jgi:ATP-dependent RNA helicase DeaD
VVSAISTKTSLAEGDIKDVSIFDNFTYVNVPKEEAEKVLEMMHESMISGRQVSVKHAKRKGDSGGKGGSGGGDAGRVNRKKKGPGKR